MNIYRKRQLGALAVLCLLIFSFIFMVRCANGSKKPDESKVAEEKVTNLKTKELSVLRCDGTGLNVVKEYTVSRKILDIAKEKYPTLNYDKNKSFFSYYIDENGETEMLSDSDLSYVYNFEIN